ncbi:hypothetical protein ACFPYI_07030 [Halomarina salina]|uniref:Carboxypeptidase regulatory-like domain-containing protein n=1 Tax=Halomarina salina TaxID=1872699 RepID=A0ABD5RKH3_9EURY|nr:hypothetical protein [Halomarina salina]
MSIRTAERLLLAATVVVALSLGGCLTLDPAVSAETGDSAVFERITATEPWAGSGVRVNATLKSTPEAGEVTSISIVQDDGRTFRTHTVDPGQSTLILSLPANERVTIVASNTVNSTTVETLNVSTGGDELL